jgi:hypothetical protein
MHMDFITTKMNMNTKKHMKKSTSTRKNTKKLKLYLMENQVLRKNIIVQN